MKAWRSTAIRLALSPICEPMACRSRRKAIAAARNAILKNFGEPYLPSAPRQYTTKAKNAQEAHEAIRPTDLAACPHRCVRPSMATSLPLYELIWKRTIASQMESAEIERTTAEIEAVIGTRTAELRAVGSVVTLRRLHRRLHRARRTTTSEDEENRRLPRIPRRRAAPRPAMRIRHRAAPPSRRRAIPKRR